DHAFCCHILTLNPPASANYLAVRHPAEMTVVAIRSAAGDAHPQLIRSRPACRDDPAPPRPAAATTPSDASREGQPPKLPRERPAPRSGQGSAGPRAVAWAARPGSCARALAE